MGKGRKKHFDMHTEKYNPTPKIKPEELVRTATSSIPMLAKDSNGRTIADFPSVSVSPFPGDEPKSVLDVEIAAEAMDENDTRITPSKENILFVQSFLRSIKRRFKFLIRQIQNHATQIGTNTLDITRLDEVTQKTDSDLWDIRMEFDGLNSKMDAILEIFEQWGVPVDDYNKTADTPPFDYGTEDGQNDVSGADVAKMVKAEQAQRKAKNIAAQNEKTIDKFLKAKGNESQAKQGTLIDTSTHKTTGYYGRTSVVDEEKPKTFPTPPDDTKKTDKSNVKNLYGKATTYHYCDMCKFSAAEAGGSRCKHSGSGFCGELVPKSQTKPCSVYQSNTSPVKSTEIFGFDFSDERAVTH